MPILNHARACRPKLRLAQLGLFAPCLLLLAALAAGCAHSRQNADGTSAFEARPAPMPPLFFNGPMALLLTNVEGFRARVVLESGASAAGARIAAGELLVRGGKMLFAPEPGGAANKKARAPDCAFIWDVKANSGYVLNEPLQGYAPYASSRQYTNLTARPAQTKPAPESIAGHPCQVTDATVTASDGAATFFQVWRATDLKGLPLRIICPANGMPVTLTLSRVQLEAAPEDLFVPPAGFTRYDSIEAMMAELALRGMNLGRKPVYPTEDLPRTGDRESPIPNHPN